MIAVFTDLSTCSDVSVLESRPWGMVTKSPRQFASLVITLSTVTSGSVRAEASPDTENSPTAAESVLHSTAQ